MAADVITVIFTSQDVSDIAAEYGADEDLAQERAENWSKYITETASALIYDQLVGAIVQDQP